MKKHVRQFESGWKLVIPLRQLAGWFFLLKRILVEIVGVFSVDLCANAYPFSFMQVFFFCYMEELLYFKKKPLRGDVYQLKKATVR